MSIRKPSISIIIPAYNEEKNFTKRKIEKVFDFLNKQKFNHEIIFVNDGSTDNTLSLLNEVVKKNKNARVLSITHGGKRAAVEAGVMNAKGKFVLFTDFDQSTPISEILKILESFQKGADVVISKRKKTYDWPLPQRIRSKIFNLLVQIIILPGFKDTQCGFKAFRTKQGRKLFKKLLVTKKNHKGRYMGAFDVELLYLAKRMGYKIKDVDVVWYCVKAERVAFSEPIKMLVDILKIRIFDLLKKYSAT